MPACELHGRTEADITRLRDDVGEIYTLVHNAEAKILELAKSSDRDDSEISRLRDELAAIAGKITIADARIVELTMRMDQRETDMERLENNQEKAIAKLEGMIQSMAAQMHGVTSQLQSVAQALHKMTDHDAAIKEVEKKVADLQIEPALKTKRRVDDFMNSFIQKIAWLVVGGAALYGIQILAKMVQGVPK